MKEIKAIGRGSKIKLTLTVGGLGELSLDDVDFKVDFYAKQMRDSVVTGIYTVTKSGGGAYMDEDDSSTVYVICDTNELDIGNLYATITVEYTDPETGAELKDAFPLDTDIVVVDAPQSEVDSVEVTISPNNPSQFIPVGSSYVCTAAVTGVSSYTLLWSSSDNSIVKIGSDGTLTAVAEGTATITAWVVVNGVVAGTGTSVVTVRNVLPPVGDN